MGIYISGVKGLPEQVQENKNKIKEVEEQIEGIDFEAVRQLQGQVAENTQDINNLEASIGVQNQAINGLKNRADALESKTQKITYDENTGKTTIDSYTIINGGLDCDNVHVVGNGTFQNANGSGLHFQEGANDDDVVLINKESGTAHDLTLHADGTLTLDGQAVGAKPLYQHNITIRRNVVNVYLTCTLTIINDSPSQFDSIVKLQNYLIEKGLTSNTNTLNATGVYDNTTFKCIIIGVCYLTALGALTLITIDTTQTTWEATATKVVPVNSSFTDLVVQIA